MLKKFTSDNFCLLYLQVLAHLGLIYQLFNGSALAWGLTLLVYFFTGCIGMTVTYHRLLSHRSWKSPAWFEYFGTFCGIWGLTGSSVGWVAIHREHHKYTDTNQDPHSPIYKNFMQIQFLSMFEKANPRYVRDLLRNPFHAKLHIHYFKIHLAIILTLFLINPLLLISCYLAPAAILWHAGSFINTINHLTGYRNYATNDNSKNYMFLGYAVWGEGWHNNHHNDPGNANFKKQWWELDIGYLCIKLLTR